MIRDAAECSAADVPKEEIERSIAEWLKSYLASLLDLAADEVDEEMAFDRLGLDSLASVSMVGDLEEWLGYELDPAMPDEHSSIKTLSRALAADEKLRAAFAHRCGP